MEAAIREKSLQLNLILDISKRLTITGESLLQQVKQEFSNIVRLTIDNYDVFHLYDPDEEFKFYYLNGEKVGLIKNYSHPVSKFSIQESLERSSNFFSQQFSSPNIIFLCTDRLQNDNLIKRFVTEVEKIGYEMKFVYISLGNYCISKIDHILINNIHLDSIRNLNIDVVKEIIK